MISYKYSKKKLCDKILDNLEKKPFLFELQNLDTLPDKELIKIYQCNECPGKTINIRCRLCEKSYNVLDDRCDSTFERLSRKIHTEFYKYNMAMSWEDIKTELKIKMIKKLKTKTDPKLLNNKWENRQYLYWYYLAYRQELYEKVRTIKRGAFEVIRYIDDFHIKLSDHHISNRYSLQTFLDFDTEVYKRRLDEKELIVFKGLCLNYKQKEIAEYMGIAESYVSIIKGRIIKKFNEIRKQEYKL